MEQQIPIIYFLGTSPGRYQPIIPTFIVGWDSERLRVQLAFGGHLPVPDEVAAVFVSQDGMVQMHFGKSGNRSEQHVLQTRLAGCRDRDGIAVAAEQGDFYKINVKAGQRVSFDCLARRIGSAIDAQMTIYDAKSMRELAYDNDSPGCQNDPRLTYTFKEAGE